MKRLSVAIGYIAFLLFLAGCEKAPERVENYFVDFATVLKPASSITFQLDNQRTLIPKELKDYTGNNGQRVVLNYSPLNGDTVKINKVTDIFTGSIQTEGFPEKLIKDPVKIQSVWVGGDYLNMILEIEYHNVAHLIALLRDTSSSTIDLYFSHSTNNDPPGAPVKLYASFLLSSLRVQGSTTAVPFRLFINTSEGMRTFQLLLP